MRACRRGRQGSGKRRGRQRRGGSQPAGARMRELPVTARVLRTHTTCTVQWQVPSLAPPLVVILSQSSGLHRPPCCCLSSVYKKSRKVKGATIREYASLRGLECALYAPRVQDGSMQEGVASAELLPVLHVDDHDFWPGEYVEDKLDPLDELGMGGARMLLLSMAQEPHPFGSWEHFI